MNFPTPRTIKWTTIPILYFVCPEDAFSIIIESISRCTGCPTRFDRFEIVFGAY